MYLSGRVARALLILLLYFVMLANFQNPYHHSMRSQNRRIIHKQFRQIALPAETLVKHPDNHYPQQHYCKASGLPLFTKVWSPSFLPCIGAPIFLPTSFSALSRNRFFLGWARWFQSLYGTLQCTSANVNWNICHPKTPWIEIVQLTWWPGPTRISPCVDAAVSSSLSSLFD